MGELVINGGMENINDDKPTDWIFTNPDDINSVTLQGRVHSGNYSVNLADGTAIEQTVPVSAGGCFYRLSFFARGEGSQVGLTATITFVTTTGDVVGGTLTVRQQDIPTDNRNFAFYQLVSFGSPANTTAVKIKIAVTANGNQSLDLDDVSLLVL